MERIRIITHFDLCTGCGICQLACSERLLGGYNPTGPCCRSSTAVPRKSVFFPRCATSATTPTAPGLPGGEAIGRDPATGALVVDRDRCIACNLCHHFHCPRCTSWAWMRS